MSNYHSAITVRPNIVDETVGLSTNRNDNLFGLNFGGFWDANLNITDRGERFNNSFLPYNTIAIVGVSGSTLLGDYTSWQIGDLVLFTDKGVQKIPLGEVLEAALPSLPTVDYINYQDAVTLNLAKNYTDSEITLLHNEILAMDEVISVANPITLDLSTKDENLNILFKCTNSAIVTISNGMISNPRFGDNANQLNLLTGESLSSKILGGNLFLQVLKKIETCDYVSGGSF